MAGGTWARQNKVRPGVYIRFRTTGGMGLKIGERGVVSICEPMSWGKVGEIMEVAERADTTPFCGYAIDKPQARFLNEIFKGSNRTTPPYKVLLYRPKATGSSQASATVEAQIAALTATAKYPGAYPISAACAQSGSGWKIDVEINGENVESKVVNALADYTSDYITLAGDMPLAAFAQELTGGLDGSATAASAAMGTVTATSKLLGEIGNNLAVSITGSAAPYTVSVKFDGTEVETASISSFDDFTSDWVELTGTIAATSELPLSAGTNGTATASTATVLQETGGLTATALYPGTRGNGIIITVTEEVDEPGSYTVYTIVDGDIDDQQTVAAISELAPNDWVSFSGDGPLTPNTGVALSGGANGTVEESAHADFLKALEPYGFDIVIYDGASPVTQLAYQKFVERMANENGSYGQLVTANMRKPDSRFVINVNSGVLLYDGTPEGVSLTPQQTCWWVGGAEAGAQYNESLTYAQYPDAVDVTPKMAHSDYVAALQAGELVLFADNERVKIEQDINALVTFTPEIGSVYHKNRIMRLCNTIANDIYKQFSANYIGVVNNNERGRMMFKSAIVNYMLDLQAREAVQNFTAKDVTVERGEEIDAIVVTLVVQAVDSVEKIYMTVEVS